MDKDENISISKNIQQQEILYSEQRFKALSDASFEAIFILKKGYILEANQTAHEMFGYEKNELKDKFASIIIARIDREEAKKECLPVTKNLMNVEELRKIAPNFI